MKYFAKIDDKNFVVATFFTDETRIQSGEFGDPSSLIEFDRDTYGGLQRLGLTPLRKNCAWQGYTYDPVKDAFIAPKPYPSWTLNEETCLWEAPVAWPGERHEGYWYNFLDNTYVWNESEQRWDSTQV
jgi:hypothetical protein